jgi:hypothetical protein
LQRANSGGATYTDTQGGVWAADKAYAAGSWGYTTGSALSSTSAVAATNDDLLYQKYREGPGEYRFTLPNGAYVVTLKFAEFTATKTSDRKMQIAMEGIVVESGLSVYGVVGKNTALDRAYNVTVSDGLLNIVFSKASGARKEPTISAIEVRSDLPPTPTPTATATATPCATCPTPTFTPTPTATPTAPPYDQRVNAGGSTYTDSQGQVWAADKAYVTGSWGYTTGSARSSVAAVAGTNDDLLYQKYREIVGEYKFTVPNGVYEVTLKFAEFVVNNGVDRIMKITMEGMVVESGLSVYAQVGKDTALDTVYTVTVNDGVLNIAFAKGSGAKKSPAISAIRVRKL